MKSKIHILCPEYVPLENKGEEAIIQGMADTIFPEGDCQFHVFDWGTDTTQIKNGIVVHPAKYYFSNWRSQEFKIGLTINEIYAGLSSIIRNLLNKFLPFWIKMPHKQARKLNIHLRKNTKCFEGFLDKNEIDYIIAGHNGGLDEYVCHLINAFYKNGIKFSVYGSSMKPRLRNKTIISLFRETLKNSDSIITRNPYAYEWASKHFPTFNIENAPDPAFGMKPLNDTEVDEYLETKNLLKFFSKPVIVLTTAEPTPISRHSFNAIKNPASKIEAHRQLLSELLKHVNSKNKYNLLFLPHTLGRDVEIAKDVIKRTNLENNSSIIVLEDDLSARMLKGIIKKAHFLIAERIHSVIGSVGVETPFLCLGSKQDLRVKGIIAQMLDCEEQIYWLNFPEKKKLIEKFDSTISRYDSIKEHLHAKNIEFTQILKEKGQQIRANINAAIYNEEL